MKRKRLSYEKRKSWIGFVFILPWVIGFVFLFARPMLNSLIYTFCKVKIQPSRLDKIFVGLENYKYVFTEDPVFIRLLVESIGKILYQVPLIIVFSLFIAVILNQEFRGRFLVRAVFFLPVIIASGVIMNILKGDALSANILSGERVSYLFQVTAFENMLLKAGLNEELVLLFTNLTNQIFELSWKSGIQILIFLAGLQTIPGTLYEASSMEGATAWETFWKVTFPMISPMIILNVIYSIIDNFNDYSNQVIRLINQHAKNLNMAYSATLSWLYFLIIFAIIGLVYAIVNKHVFYSVE